MRYPIDWFSIEQAEGTTFDRPGIYRWEIEGYGMYVGRFTRRSRPVYEYAKNVYRQLNGIAYRPGNPDGFRAVRIALAGAVRQNSNVVLRLLMNCDCDTLNQNERRFISESPVAQKLNGVRRAGFVSCFNRSSQT